MSVIRSICLVYTSMSAQDRLIRALELKLEILEHGLGMPRDEYAIAQTKAMLEQARLDREVEEDWGRPIRRVS